jgi:hypothetical protein
MQSAHVGVLDSDDRCDSWARSQDLRSAALSLWASNGGSSRTAGSVSRRIMQVTVLLRPADGGAERVNLRLRRGDLAWITASSRGCKLTSNVFREPASGACA